MGYVELTDFKTGMRRLVSVGVLLNCHVIEMEKGCEIVRLDNGESIKVYDSYDRVHEEISSIVQGKKAEQAHWQREAARSQVRQGAPQR